MCASTRTYRSEVRRERAGATRAAIVDAAADLLSEERAPGVSLQEVADRAGVGIATVYRHYGTKEDLYEAVYAKWMQSAPALLSDFPELDLDGFLALLPDLWRRQSENPRLAEAMSTYSSAGRSVRRRRLARRRKVVGDLLADQPVSGGDRLRLEAVVLLLTSTTAHKHLRDHWDMSTDEAAETVTWAVRALLHASGLHTADGLL